jgi:hypothetical protein
MRNTKTVNSIATVKRHKTRYLSRETSGYSIFTAVVANEVIAQPSHDGSVDNDYVMLTAIVTSLKSRKASDPGTIIVTAQKLKTLERPRIMLSRTLPDRGVRSITYYVRGGFLKPFIQEALLQARIDLNVLHEEKQEYSLRHDL